MQVGRRNSCTIVLCRDSDLVAYSHKLVFIIDSYGEELWRMIDMRIDVSSEIAENFPLYAYYCKYGIRVIHWWAAVMGCDISEKRAGISDASEKTFIAALRTFNDGGSSSLGLCAFS